MADVAAVLNILLTANATQANAQLAKTQAGLTATQRKAEVTGAAMKKALLGVGVAAGAAGVALFKIGEEFDDAYDKIRTGTGATGKELKKLEMSFRDVVASVPASFDDASTAISGLNSQLGLTGKPLEKVAKQVTELSRITGTDVKGNVEGISKAFNDWDVKTQAMGRTLDGFYRLSQNSGVSVSDLTTAVQQFGSPLRQLGFSLGDAAAMWATFVRAGVNTQTMVPGLKLAIASLTAPTDELRAKMEDLGIAVGKPDVALQQILDLLGSGSTLSQIEKTTLAMEVFGKRAGADMAEAIKQGRFEVDDMLDTFRKGDDTIRGSGRETMDLAEQWQRFTNLLKLKVEPIASEVFSGLGRLMKQVTRAFKRDGFDGVLKLMTQKLNEVLPKVADAGAKIGLAILKGISGAFWNSSILGKLFIAGTFMRLVGGAGVFGKIGAAMGGRMLTGMSTTIADGKGLKGPASRFGTAFGGLAGPYVAAMVMSAMAGIEFGKSGWVQENTTDITKYTSFLMDRYDLTQKRAERVVSYMKKHPGLGAEESMKAINYKRTFADLFRGFDMTSDKSRDTARDIDKDQNDIGRSLNQSGNKSRRFGEVVSGNFNILGGAIGNALRTIGNNTNKVLGSLSADRIKFSIEQSEKTGGFHGLQRGGLVPGLRTGALVPGTGSGDTVPLHLAGKLVAMVEPREYVSVANRNATAALMAQNAKVPRFAGGGVIQQALGPYDMPPIAYDPNHAGGNSHLHLDFFTKQQALAYGHKMQGMGWTIGEYTGSNPYGFGPVTVQHQSAAHYDGTGFDANTAADETRAEVAAVVRMLGGAAGGVAAAAAQKIARLVLKGPDGPLKDMGQAAIDKATKAANAYIAKHQPTDTGVGYISGGDNAVAAQIGHILLRQGFDRAAAAGIIGNAYRESLWDPGSIGSGGGGLWGFTTSPVSLADLQTFASNQGKPWTDVGLQTQFMLMHGGMDLQGVLNALNSPEQTAAMFMTAWERPGVPALEERQSAARRAYNMKGWQEGGIVAKLASGGIVDIGKAIGRTFGAEDGKKVSAGDLRKRISKQLGRRIDKLSEMGIPLTGDGSDLAGRLADLRATADRYSDYASNAGTLSSDGATVPFRPGTEPDLDKLINGSEAYWTTKQLDALLMLRNALIKTEKVIDERRKKVMEMLERNRKWLREWEQRLRKAEHKLGSKGHTPGDWKGIDPATDDVGKWNALSADKRAQLMAKFAAAGGKLPGDRKFTDSGALITAADNPGRFPNVAGMKAVQALLKNVAIPGLKTERGQLNSARGTALSKLATVQGDVPNHSILKQLPALGVLGGEIFTAQSTLAQLGAAANVTDDGVLAGLLQSQLEDARRENALLRAQMPVFQSMVPYMGEFATGGVALVGERGPELASLPSGTRVTSAAETRSMMEPEVSLILNDCTIDTHGQTLEEAVKVVVNDELREVGRISQRRTPTPV